MCHWTLVTLGLCLSFIANSCAWEHVSGDEAQAMIAKNGGVAVAYIRHSSEISGNLDPEWSSAATEAQVLLISVDCSASPDICTSYGVLSHTTVKLFIRDKKPSVYAGPRRASAIFAWVERMQRPVVTEIGIKEIDDFKSLDEAVFIAYLDADDEASKATFAEVASQFKTEFTFGLTTDAGVLQSEAATPPFVQCYKPRDGDTHHLASFVDADGLDKFVKEASRPVIGELLSYNHQRFLDRGWPMVYVFARTETERAQIRDSLHKMARSYYESLTMVTVDPLDFPDLPARLGLEPGVFPAGAVHQLSTDRIYPYPKGLDITPRELQGWGLDVWQGRVKPWMPPGATKSDDGGGFAGRIQATHKISMRNLNIPGVNIRVGGHNEL
ncbi:thioredoxin-like domain-containing protein [Biscogniauxia mediterranea]|nr:thioredoxin-like domain-containing protein [Biscogniauxia mediterranea]